MEIKEKLIQEELKESYVDYAMSVIMQRALPDVRDGLKPVHRRILYSMQGMGLSYNKPFVKSARIVGECFKYHPHGDASIYDALVRMAQDFSLRYPLVKGHGNFGSDSFEAAHMRYCITGDSLIITKKGLIRIDELSNKENINVKILSKDKKINEASKWFDSGDHPTLKIVTNKGYSLTGSYNHPVLTLNKDEFGKPIFVWKLLENLNKGDFVVIDRSSDDLWPEKNVKLYSYFPKLDNGRTKIRVLPKYMNEDLAFILGSFISEGSFSKNKIEFCNTDEEWINNILRLWSRTFPDSKLHKFKRKPSSYGKKEYYRLECHCRYTLKFLENIGLKFLKSPERQIPNLILQSPKKVVISFLKSYFEGDGTISFSKNMIELGCCSRSGRLINEIQILLLRFGIDSAKRFDKYKMIWKIYIRSYKNILRFYKEIGFLSDYKNKKLEYIVYSYKKDASLTDYIPFISDYIRNQTTSSFVMKNNFDRYTNMKKNYGRVSSILLEDTGENYSKLFEYLLNYNYLFDEVIDIEKAGIQRVYSIKVESKCHSFISNGFISHNTEAKLEKIGEELLQDIDKNTVDFVPNFDGSLKEPILLPSKIPNLLINGTSGIAVGMASNIPPHNIAEVIDATVYALENEEFTVEDMMNFIKGPDFPTGASILGINGIKSAYKTGRGKIRIRSKAKIEKNRIIVYEIPYMVNKSLLLESMGELIKDKRIEGISDLRDESSRNEIRVVIELKKDHNPDVVLNNLYKNTQLETSFGVNIVALYGNEPKIINLKNLVSYFIEHRKIVVTRRTKFELEKSESRKHILEGILIALQNIDDIVELIKKSKDVGTAREGLIVNYNLSEKQAQAILEMRLQRLTNLEQEKINEEHKNLIELIKELKEILESIAKLKEVIRKELTEIKDNYKDERRTEILDVEDDVIDDEDLIKEEDIVITFTNKGYIKSTRLEEYKQQKRGGKGLIATTTGEDDFVEDLFVVNNLSTIMFFTNLGRLHWLKAYQIPQGTRYGKGKAIVNLIELSEDEKINSILGLMDFNEGYLMFCTKEGILKKSDIKLYSKPRKGGINAINLSEDDEVVKVLYVKGGENLIIGTYEGVGMRFNERDIKSTGRNSSGVIGIRLTENDKVIGMEKALENSSLFTVTENGFGKRTGINDYRLIRRGGKGVLNIKTKYLYEDSRNEGVVGIRNVFDDDELMFITKNGITIRVKVSQFRDIGRNTSGVRLIKLDENDKVVSIEKIVGEEEVVPNRNI